MDRFLIGSELPSSDIRPVAPVTIPVWQQNTYYIKDAPVISPVDGSLCIAKAAFASGTTFNANNWTTIAISVAAQSAAFVSSPSSGSDGQVLTKDSTVTPQGVKWATGGGSGAVASVAGKTGVVSLVKADVGLGNVDNTSDVNKPISTVQASAIANAQTAAIAGAPVQSVATRTGAVILTATDVGLGTVAASIASLPATYASLASPHFTGTPLVNGSPIGAGGNTPLNDRGTWVTGAAYVIDDVVTQAGTRYACKTPHTSSASFAADAVANWVQTGSESVTTVANLATETLRATTAEGLAVQKSNNLSDLASAVTARTNLGLGTAAVTAASAFDAAGSANAAQTAAVTAAASASSAAIATQHTSDNSIYAPLVSPALTGTPTAPTPTAGDSSTKLATTAFVAAGGGSVTYGTTAGTAAQGNDARIDGAAQKGNNLGDLTNRVTARNNLWLGSAATTDASAYDAAGAAATAQTAAVIAAAAAAAAAFVPIRATPPDPAVNPSYVDSTTSPPSLKSWNGSTWIAVSGPALTASTASTLRYTSGPPVVLATDIVGDFAVDPASATLYGPLTGSPVLAANWVNGGTSDAAITLLGGGSGAVTSVAGRTGAVTLTAIDVPIATEAMPIPNCLGATNPRNICNNFTQTAAPTGVIRVAGRWFDAGQVIGRLAWASGTVAAITPTHSYMVLMNSSGVVLATTADNLTLALPATTLFTWPLAAPGSTYTISTSGFYYFGVSVSAATVPTYTGASVGAGPLNVAPFMSAQVSGAAAAPPAVGSTQLINTPNGQIPWMAAFI